MDDFALDQRRIPVPQITDRRDARLIDITQGQVQQEFERRGNTKLFQPGQHGLGGALEVSQWLQGQLAFADHHRIGFHQRTPGKRCDTHRGARRIGLAEIFGHDGVDQCEIA